MQCIDGITPPQDCRFIFCPMAELQNVRLGLVSGLHNEILIIDQGSNQVSTANNENYQLNIEFRYGNCAARLRDRTKHSVRPLLRPFS